MPKLLLITIIILGGVLVVYAVGLTFAYIFYGRFWYLYESKPKNGLNRWRK